MFGPMFLELPAFLKEDDLQCLERSLQEGGLEDLVYKHAKVYSRDNGARVDLEQRVGKVHTGHAEGVFEAARHLLLPNLQAAKPEGIWTLLANHYDVLYYGEGDFFRKHVDFTPAVTRHTEPYVMLLCLRGGCVGGRTRLWISEEESLLSEMTVVRGSALVFHGNLAHEGNLIERGEKVVARFDFLFARGLIQELPFFEAQERFSALSGTKMDSLSAEDTSLLERYASGHQTFDCGLTHLQALLDFVGCPEASALSPRAFQHFIEEGFVIEEGRSSRKALQEAGMRRGLCCLLIVVKIAHEKMEYELADYSFPPGIAACFQDGSPAFFSGLERCRNELGLQQPGIIEKLSDAARQSAAKTIFTSHDPNQMEKDFVIWTASIEMQRESSDIERDLNSRMTLVVSARSALSEIREDDNYTDWIIATGPLASRIIEEARNHPRLSMRRFIGEDSDEDFDKDAYFSTSSKTPEYCSCDGGDTYSFSRLYSTVAFNEAWCLVRGLWSSSTSGQCVC